MMKMIGHLGNAVQDLEKSITAISRALDLPIPPIRDKPEKKMNVAVVDPAGIGLEFIEDFS